MQFEMYEETETNQSVRQEGVRGGKRGDRARVCVECEQPQTERRCLLFSFTQRGWTDMFILQCPISISYSFFFFLLLIFIVLHLLNSPNINKSDRVHISKTITPLQVNLTFLHYSHR